MLDLIGKFMSVPAPSLGEGRVREYVTNYLNKRDVVTGMDGMGNLFFGDPDSEFVLCAHMDRIDSRTYPHLEFTHEQVRGKLDDTVGLAAILSLAGEGYSFFGVLTVAEEMGSIGAESFVKEDLINPDAKVIVIDTSALGVGGKGPLIYHSSAGEPLDEELANYVSARAERAGIPIQHYEGRSNDSRIFARKYRTIAIETHIDNIHQFPEVAYISDLASMYNLLVQTLKD